MRGKVRAEPVDVAIARLAAPQYGVVTRDQLRSAGVGDSAIDRRIAAGRLYVIHRGVYAVGHPGLATEGLWTAAVLTTDGVLSHRPAAALWGMRQDDGIIEVIAARARQSRSGIRVHHLSLPSTDVTSHRNIRVTSPERTLTDLAAVVDAKQLRRAVREAQYSRLVDAANVEVTPRRHGAPALRAIVATDEVTRSTFEDAFLAFVERRGLPRPETNVVLPFGEADCIWRDVRVNVELDGNAAHGTRDAFERDRARDRAAALAGWTVVRITWRQFQDERRAVEADLRRLLERSARS